MLDSTDRFEHHFGQLGEPCSGRRRSRDVKRQSISAAGSSLERRRSGIQQVPVPPCYRL